MSEEMKSRAADEGTTGIAKAVSEGAGAVQDAEESGYTPELTETAARTVMAGAIDSRGGGCDGRALIQQTAADLVRGAGDVDANVAGTAKGAVAGAIEAGQDTGIDKEVAAEAAAMGAIEGAGDIGDATVEQVKLVVTGEIDDVTPLDESMFTTGRRVP